MKQRERLAERGKMELMNSVIHKETRRKRRVTSEEQSCSHLSQALLDKSQEEESPGVVEAEQETDVCTWLCRFQQTKWEICIIPDYLTRNVLKMASDSYETER